MRTLLIASAKGGSSKTSTAIHLAEYLSRKRSVGDVCLLDGDPDNESASNWYDRGDNWKFGLVRPGEAVPDCDILIVDAGAAPDSEDLAALLDNSDLLIVPTAPSVMDLESAVKTASQFDLGAGDVKLLLSIVPPGRAKAGPKALTTLQKNEIPVCPQMIYRRTCVAQAAEWGLTVAEMTGQAAATSWVEYQTAFRWILKGVM